MKALIFIGFWLLNSIICVAYIQDIRVWPSPDYTRVVFDVDQKPSYQVFSLNNPFRVVVDLKNTTVKKNIDIQSLLSGDRIVQARTATRHKVDLRMVFDVKAPLEIKHFVLKPSQTYSYHRLVIDVYDKTIKKPKKPLSVVKKSAIDFNHKKQNIVIAIDAGHGGEDPGAIGYRGIQEKKVVLAIAKQLAALLKATPGYTPYLTRSGDYYLDLRKRMRKARKAQADLFISIHADAFKNSKARGSSVFVLSDQGATSEGARFLAERENESDLVGGVNLDQQEDHVAMTLLDLAMTATQETSLLVANELLKRLKKVTNVHKKQVEQASFVVLKSPDIPAVLIETGFISNPGEAKRLSKKKYQYKIAKELHQGIINYFSTTPFSDT